MKNICVFCSSSDAVNPIYYEAATELSAAIAKHGLTLVYGGCKVGLMGRVAKTAKKNGGKVIGIIPKNIHNKGLLQEGLDELIITEGMRERKALMENMSDAFIALPGGFGTLEEILEMLTYRQLKIHAKPIIFLNTNNFYSPLISFFETFYQQKFAKPNRKNFISSQTTSRTYSIIWLNTLRRVFQANGSRSGVISYFAQKIKTPLS